jgi:hypothetical protein
MTRRTQLILFALGMLLLFCSAVIFIYATWPAATSTVQSTLQPTLFMPP